MTVLVSSAPAAVAGLSATFTAKLMQRYSENEFRWILFRFNNTRYVFEVLACLSCYFFLKSGSFYLLTARLEGYNWTCSHSLTPLDKGSAHRREFYLHNTIFRSEKQIQKSESNP
jgi:hypothetical protein